MSEVIPEGFDHGADLPADAMEAHAAQLLGSVRLDVDPHSPVLHAMVQQEVVATTDTPREAAAVAKEVGRQLITRHEALESSRIVGLLLQTRQITEAEANAMRDGETTPELQKKFDATAQSLQTRRRIKKHTQIR